MTTHEQLMEAAIAVAKEGIAAGQSPFGAVIADMAGDVLVAAHNTVRQTCDVTAHAEITAIRLACEKLGRLDLSGFVIATTCEPCPMCAAAIHWARLDAVAYGATIADAQAARFNEMPIPAESLFRLGRSRVRVHQAVLRERCGALFDSWKQGSHPTPY